jgi:hypothetical protein
MKITSAAILAALLGAAVCGGCGPSGRLKAQDEDRKVGYKRAGAPEYERLMQSAVGALLDEHEGAIRAQGKMMVAFVGIENKSAEELGDIKDAMYEIIDTQLVNRKIYTNVNRRYVEAAEREANIRDVEELLLPPGRARFMQVLGRQSLVPDYLLWAKITSMTTDTSSDTKDRDYLLTMEMVNANTGETTAKKTAKITKEYKS